MTEAPIYRSECTARNLWQRYEIYPNRVELHTHFGNLVVPFENLENAEVYPPVLKSLRLHLKKCIPIGIKLDTSDISEHIVLDKKTDFIRHVLFTPENPNEFQKALKEAMEAFRAKQATEANNHGASQ